MKRKVLGVFSGLLLIVLTIQPVNAQKEKYHSIFIYNFSKYVKWPDAQSSGTFVIGVLGNSVIQKDLKTMAANKRVNGMSIEVKQFKNVDEIGSCHILYVSEMQSGKINQIVSSTSDQPILIVTNRPGMTQKGATINFVEIEGKIKFELNQKNADARGLKVAGSLASLAIMV